MYSLQLMSWTPRNHLSRSSGSSICCNFGRFFCSKIHSWYEKGCSASAAFSAFIKPEYSKDIPRLTLEEEGMIVDVIVDRTAPGSFCSRKKRLKSRYRTNTRDSGVYTHHQIVAIRRATSSIAAMKKREYRNNAPNSKQQQHPQQQQQHRQQQQQQQMLPAELFEICVEERRPEVSPNAGIVGIEHIVFSSMNQKISPIGGIKVAGATVQYVHPRPSCCSSYCCFLLEITRTKWSYSRCCC